jgi:hypothetical protein
MNQDETRVIFINPNASWQERVEHELMLEIEEKEYQKEKENEDRN